MLLHARNHIFVLSLKIVVGLHLTVKRTNCLLYFKCCSTMAENEHFDFENVKISDNSQDKSVKSLPATSTAVPSDAHPVSHVVSEPSKRKQNSFQITSVTVKGSRISTDGGEDSADDLDESHTEDANSDNLDCSRTTDGDVEDDKLNTSSSRSSPKKVSPSISQDTKDFTQKQVSSEKNISSNGTKENESHHNCDNTQNASSKPSTLSDQWQHRFRVVKIVSSEPYKRGRWLCMDFMDPPAPLVENAEIVQTAVSSKVEVIADNLSETIPADKIAHIYEISPSAVGNTFSDKTNETQQPMYGIFLPLNNSQYPLITGKYAMTIQPVNNNIKLQDSPQSINPDKVFHQSQMNTGQQQTTIESASLSMSQGSQNIPSGVHMQSVLQHHANMTGVLHQPQSISLNLQQPVNIHHTSEVSSNIQQQVHPVTIQPHHILLQNVPGGLPHTNVNIHQQNIGAASQQPHSVPGTIQHKMNNIHQQNISVGLQHSSVTMQQQIPVSIHQTIPANLSQHSISMSMNQPVIQPSNITHQNIASGIQHSNMVSTMPHLSNLPVSMHQNIPEIMQQQNIPASSMPGMISSPHRSQNTASGINQQARPLNVQQQVMSGTISSTSMNSNYQQTIPANMQQPVQHVQNVPDNVSVQIQGMVENIPMQKVSISMQQPHSLPTTMQHSHSVPSSLPQIQNIPAAHIITQQQNTPRESVVHITQQSNPSNVTQPCLSQPTTTQQSGFPNNSVQVAAKSKSSSPPQTQECQQHPTHHKAVTEHVEPPSSNHPTFNQQTEVASQVVVNHIEASTPPAPAQEKEQVKSEVEGEEAETVPSGASSVAIDNKIEQAMDLVKSHLMFAVREEVDVLKEKITELMERISQLEYENGFLKANASAQTLEQLNQHPHS